MPDHRPPLRVPLMKGVTLEGTRAQIVELLRKEPMGASDLARALGMTHNGVRMHLTALARAGLVREAGLRRGATRPVMLYDLTPQAETALSNAYVPFLAQLLRTLHEQMPRKKLDDLMKSVGRALAEDWPRLRGPLDERVNAASRLLNEMGALTEVESTDHTFVIRGHGCLLSEAVHGRRSVCLAIESLLTQLLDTPVNECCERGERPRCCFRIGNGERQMSPS